jgi:hypothetical protein
MHACFFSDALLPLVCCRTPSFSVSPQAAGTASGHTPVVSPARTFVSCIPSYNPSPVLMKESKMLLEKDRFEKLKPILESDDDFLTAAEHLLVDGESIKNLFKELIKT